MISTFVLAHSMMCVSVSRGLLNLSWQTVSMSRKAVRPARAMWLDYSLSSQEGVPFAKWREEFRVGLSGRDDTFVSLVYPFEVFRLPPGREEEVPGVDVVPCISHLVFDPAVAHVVSGETPVDGVEYRLHKDETACAPPVIRRVPAGKVCLPASPYVDA